MTYPGVNNFFDSSTRDDGSENGLITQILFGMLIAFESSVNLLLQNATALSASDMGITFNSQRLCSFSMTQRVLFQYFQKKSSTMI